MNRSDFTLLSVGELEQLIGLYYDGLLSRAEESDLRKVLAFTSLTSPSIALARAAMGLESAMRPSGTKRSVNLWRNIAVAASVAVVAGAGMVMSRNTAPGISCISENTEVYIAGRKVSDSALARLITERSYLEDMAFLEQMMADQRREAAEYHRMIEELQNKNL